MQKSIKQQINDDSSTYEIEMIKKNIHDYFKNECLAICQNEQVLCNLIVDLCYKDNNKSKQFCWGICGDLMVRNLLKHRNYKLTYPKQSEDGDFTYKGLTFKMEEVVYEINSK